MTRSGHLLPGPLPLKQHLAAIAIVFDFVNPVLPHLVMLRRVRSREGDLLYGPLDNRPSWSRWVRLDFDSEGNNVVISDSINHIDDQV